MHTSSRAKKCTYANRDDLARLIWLPIAEEFEECRVRRAVGQHLGHEVYVRDKCGIQNNRHISRVEKLDGIRPGLPSSAHHLDRDVYFPALDIAARDEDENRRQEIGYVGQILPI